MNAVGVQPATGLGGLFSIDMNALPLGGESVAATLLGIRVFHPYRTLTHTATKMLALRAFSHVGQLIES